MTVAKNDLVLPGGPDKQGNKDILLIEDSVALSTLLTGRLEGEAGARVVNCGTMEDARKAIAERPFAVALTGLNLPDAPDGEILDLLCDQKVPTIVFTAMFDRESRRKCTDRRVVDYIIKDGRRTVDSVVHAVKRFFNNSSYKILVVDDFRAARSDLVYMLRRQNFCVFEARSGRQALEILAEHEEIELVLTDYLMPDMDGYELTRRIRETKSSEELRIVGISSSSDRLLSASFLKAGASDFIYRPFVPEELQCRIDNNIETLTQLKRLRRLAERDFLTGLANRRHFFESMQSLEANGLSGSVAILDLDHFKSVNDTYGHDTGDRVLTTMSAVLTRLCEPVRYLPARLGGEEFAIYLPKADAFQSHTFCENLRLAIEDTPISIGDSTITVTASIGVAEIEPNEPFSNQLNAADQLLYLAKAKGRNRVYSSLTLPEAIQLSVVAG